MCIWKIAEVAGIRVFFCLGQWRSAKGQSQVEGGGEKPQTVKGGNFCDEHQAEMNKRRILHFFRGVC